MTTPPSTNDMADTFVALRMATLRRTPGFFAGSAARERLYGFFSRTRALPSHHVVLPGRAQLYLFHDPRAWFGRPCTLAFLDRALGDDDALAFLGQALRDQADELGPETLLEVAADDLPLVELALSMGLSDDGQPGFARPSASFAIDSLVLVGSPTTARRRLPPAALPPDLALRPLEHTDIDTVVALHRDTFTAAPERCWFGAYPEHLETLRRGLVEARRNGTRSGYGHDGQLGLFQSGRLVGHAGVDIEDNAFWGRVGGIELVLRPELTGRGLARPLYSALLDRLIAAGCDTMKGGTNQPAVLHLGRLMRRPWHVFNLRRQSPFALEHFTAHLTR